MTQAARRLTRLVEQGYIDSAAVARVLQKDPKTVTRWLVHDVKPRWETRQRLLELEAVLEKLGRIVEVDAAEDWLFTPIPLLNYERPAVLVRKGRFKEVLAAIDALGEGAFL